MTSFGGSLAHFSGDPRELGPAPCRLMTDLGEPETLRGESGGVQPAGNIFGNIELLVLAFAFNELPGTLKGLPAFASSSNVVTMVLKIPSCNPLPFVVH